MGNFAEPNSDQRFYPRQIVHQIILTHQGFREMIQIRIVCVPAVMGLNMVGLIICCARIRRIFTMIVASAFVICVARSKGGEPPVLLPPSTNPSTSTAATKDSSPPGPSNPLNGPQLTETPTWSEALRAVLLTAIPDKYEDLRHWDKTREVFGGVKVQQKGLNIRLSERKRTVKDGAWHRYKIELMDPARHLKLLIGQIHAQGPNRFQFEIRLAAKIRCRGDFEHWVLGVKGLNGTVVSEADVQMVANCQLSIRTETTGKSLLPDLILEPKVNRIRLFLSNLDVKRIGELRGDLAEGIGDLSRHEIENLLQAQEDRAVRKANEAIDKKRDSLRIPVSKLW